MKKTLFLYFLGLFSGVVLLGLFLFLRQIGEGFSHWGDTQICSDKEVRASIAGSGIKLPEDAHDLYYAIEGFRDHRVWIKFSVPKDKLWKIVEESTQKNKMDFKEGIQETFLLEVIQHKNQKLDVSWWNPKEVTHPLSWSKVEDRGPVRNFEDWMVDEENSTIYATMGSI